MAQGWCGSAKVVRNRCRSVWVSGAKQQRFSFVRLRTQTLVG
nr:MAG TPA: hypothetical protein [Caudoviricetes sp.]